MSDDRTNLELLRNREQVDPESRYKQYALFVEMADRISARRLNVSSFFLTINTVLLGWTGYLMLKGGSAFSGLPGLPLPLSGMIICYTWYRLLKSYRGHNTAKFKLIHEIEKDMPYNLYAVEWKLLKEGKMPDVYSPFTDVEMCVPWVFFVMHTIVFLAHIFLL